MLQFPTCMHLPLSVCTVDNDCAMIAQPLLVGGLWKELTRVGGLFVGQSIQWCVVWLVVCWEGDQVAGGAAAVCFWVPPRKCVS